MNNMNDGGRMGKERRRGKEGGGGRNLGKDSS